MDFDIPDPCPDGKCANGWHFFEKRGNEIDAQCQCGDKRRSVME